jgi:hypothetical protein
MVYVYGITDSPAAPVAGQQGLEDRPLEVCAVESISAVYTRHEMKTPPPPTPETAWRHERVVEWLMRERAVLPARFGTTFHDEAKLRAALAPHERELAAGLERLRGCVELGVRVLWEATPAPGPAVITTAMPAPPLIQPSPDSGRAYMLARLEEERHRREERQRADRLVDELHAPLAPLAVDSTRRVLTTPQTLLVAAYLVPRDRTDAFRERVRELGPAHPALRIVCTGPWPPYHFVPQLGEAAAEVARG